MTGAKRARAPRVPFTLLVVGLLVGGLVLLLALNTASAANELRRGALATKDQEVSADVAQLRNEVAASAAPASLARAAGELGMVPAGHAAFIVELPDGRTVLRGHAGHVSDDPLDIPTGTAHAAPKPTTRAPAPTPSASTTPTTSTSSATSKPSASTSKTPTSTAGPRRKHPAATVTRSVPHASPAPSSTPTPTITLPGGDR